MVEIFLAPKVAPKRALTFLTNGAVTNFAPERMYQIDADLLRTNVLVQNTYMVQQSISVLRAKNRALNDKRKIRKTVCGKGCHHLWVAALLVLQGVVLPVLGRGENGESELNTWKSAAIFAPVLA